MVPSAVQTGCLNGCKLAAQKLKGSLLKFAPFGAFWFTFEPALAEYASEEAHSEWVICLGSQYGGGLRCALGEAQY